MDNLRSAQRYLEVVEDYFALPSNMVVVERWVASERLAWADLLRWRNKRVFPAKRLLEQGLLRSHNGI